MYAEVHVCRVRWPPIPLAATERDEAVDVGLQRGLIPTCRSHPCVRDPLRAVNLVLVSGTVAGYPSRCRRQHPQRGRTDGLERGAHGLGDESCGRDGCVRLTGGEGDDAGAELDDHAVGDVGPRVSGCRDEQEQRD